MTPREPGFYWVRFAGDSDRRIIEYDGQFVRFFGVETRARPEQIHEWGSRIEPPSTDPGVRGAQLALELMQLAMKQRHVLPDDLFVVDRPPPPNILRPKCRRCGREIVIEGLEGSQGGCEVRFKPHDFDDEEVP